jgi:hypothetical protein
LLIPYTQDIEDEELFILLQMLDALKVLFILTGASTYLGKRFNDGTCRETVV